ncbi:hypothetical protein BDP27DRAFT_1416444 [Rhodocollybia butyracea]|uniref:Zn(2)-C6 fungal-type domain-containing protein n=1 Tax=Rhodocollybia butyracea TaxID=206335 RepID=A0A9P5Q3U5_9AGAR|nr:hypothetical protein BDP27DRAFT_1416444 [Rhodocollybia butyracea]
MAELSTKRKKIASCDFCKAKRVLCHPVETGSCPRCADKGLICTTTPVVRKKRRTKAELQNQRKPESSASQASTPDLCLDGPSTSLEVWTGSQKPSRNLPAPGLDLPSSLVRELFQDLRTLPHFHYPLLPLKELETSLRRRSWHLPALPPHERVLAHCILAITARITSSTSIIVGLDQHKASNLATREPLYTRSLNDFRDFGKKRENICEQLRGEAVWLAQQEAIMINSNAHNAISLSILDFLEYRASGKGGNAYTSAYIHSLRYLSEQSDLSRNSVDRIKFSAYLMAIALCAVSTGAGIPFTHHDQLLMCGEDPTISLEEITNRISTNSLGKTPIFDNMRPLSLHVISLARDISEHITGTFARRHPLDEAELISKYNSLDLLHTTISTCMSQMQNNQHVIEKSVFQWMRYCTFPLLHAWSTLALLVFEELKRRRELIRVNSLTESLDIPGNTIQSRLDLLYLQFRAMASQAPLKSPDHSKKFPRFRELRDGLNVAGFSWVDQTGVVGDIDKFLLSSGSNQQVTDVTDHTVTTAELEIWSLPLSLSGGEDGFAAWAQSLQSLNPLGLLDIGVEGGGGSVDLFGIGAAIGASSDTTQTLEPRIHPIFN